MKSVKWPGFLLAMFLVFSMLVACSNTDKTGNEAQGTPDSSQSDSSDESSNDESNSESKYLASEEPLDMSIFLHYADRIVFQDDWAVFNKAAKLTNITLHGTASETATDSEEVFNLMISNSEDLPDIIRTTKANFNKFGSQGAFVPLNDLIKEYAPHLQAFLKENPDVRKFATAPDGNMYFIPFVPDGKPAKGWFIRKDWLDELGLDIPKTVQEYHDVLKAFREQDPNGNGKKDEKPYFARAPSGLTDLLVLWGAYSELYLDGDQIKFGPLMPSYKTGMKNLAKWYSEGLIDPEIFTRGVKSRDVLLTNNTGGATHDWFGSTSSYNSLLKDKIPGFKFVPMAPPENVNGKQIETTRRASVKPVGWGISTQNKNKEAAMKYFDFWFTDKGRRMENFGVEGKTYTMVDGKPKFTDKVLNSGDVATYLHKFGAQIEFGFHQNFAYEKQWTNPIALKGELMYDKNNYYMEQIPALSFTSEEQKTITELKTAIKTYVDETTQKWILGSQPVEGNFKAFQQHLKELGAEKYLSIYQKAYERYLSK